MVSFSVSFTVHHPQYRGLSSRIKVAVSGQLWTDRQFAPEYHAATVDIELARLLCHRHIVPIQIGRHVIGTVYSSDAGDVYDFEWSATGTSIRCDGPLGQATVMADGVDTGIQVDFDTAADGTISNVRPSSDADAQQLEQLTGVGIAPSDQPEENGTWEPEPVDTQALNIAPVDDDTPPQDLTPEELELAFTTDPAPFPETPIHTTPDTPVTSAPTVPQPVSAPPVPPPDVQTPVATVTAPSLPGFPPLTLPVIDNGPLFSPQSVTDAGPTSMPGGSNDTGSPGTPTNGT